VLELEHELGAAPLLNVFGGKVTTYRRLSEHALQKLKPFFPAVKVDWTARAKLPGGDIPGVDFEGLYEVKRRRSATGMITQTGQHDRRA
jgi:D-erythritol 1-phosphate dehydrogenase